LAEKQDRGKIKETAIVACVYLGVRNPGLSR
jgi:hypothetical protein